MPELPNIDACLQEPQDAYADEERLDILLDANTLRDVAGFFGILTPKTEANLPILGDAYEQDATNRQEKLLRVAGEQAITLFNAVFELHQDYEPLRDIPIAKILQNSYGIGLEFALLPSLDANPPGFNETTALREILNDPVKWIEPNVVRERFQYTPFARQIFQAEYAPHTGCPAIATRLTPYGETKSTNLFLVYWNHLTSMIVEETA